MTISSIYPRPDDKANGIFIKRRLGELSKICRIQLFVPLSPYKPKPKFLEVPENVDVYAFRYPKFPQRSFLFFTEGFFLAASLLYGLLSMRIRFDLIHANFAYPTGFSSVVVSKIVRKPVVVMAMGSDINSLPDRGFLLRWLISWTVRRADYLIAVSNELRDKMIKLGASPEKIDVIAVGVELSEFRPEDKKECRKKLSLPLEGVILLFVGHLIDQKGVTYLIDSVNEALKKKSDFTLILVGDGSLKEGLIYKTERLGIKGHVHFAGARPPDEMPLWMNACDVFILPSESEGTPNVILEAIACGKPIIATNVGGIPDFVSNENGILVEPKSMLQLKDAILTLVKDAELRAHLGKGSLLVRERKIVDWKTNARKIHEIYMKLTEDEHPNPR